jgi:hypothetical protein
LFAPYGFGAGRASTAQLFQCFDAVEKTNVIGGLYSPEIAIGKRQIFAGRRRKKQKVVVIDYQQKWIDYRAIWAA